MVVALTFLISLGGISLALTKQESPHGGIIKDAEGYFIEMKSSGKNLSIYLLNKKYQSIGTKNVMGKAQFFLSDSTSIDIPLKRLNENAFTCVAPSGYITCKVTFNVMGKSVSAKFPAQNLVVLKD